MQFYCEKCGALMPQSLECGECGTRLALGKPREPKIVADSRCGLVFKSERCRYSGEESWCDNTLARCSDLGNAHNWPGLYPPAKDDDHGEAMDRPNPASPDGYA